MENTQMDEEVQNLLENIQKWMKFCYMDANLQQENEFFFQI